VLDDIAAPARADRAVGPGGCEPGGPAQLAGSFCAAATGPLPTSAATGPARCWTPSGLGALPPGEPPPRASAAPGNGQRDEGGDGERPAAVGQHDYDRQAAGTAAFRAAPRSTRAAATMQPRYTARKRAVGIATSDAVLTSRSPYSVIRSRPAAAIAARNRGAGPRLRPAVLREPVSETSSRIEAALLAIPAIVACYLVSGTDDFLMEAAVPDLASYEQLLLGHILTIPSVVEARSTFAIRTILSRCPLPLGHWR